MGNNKSAIIKNANIITRSKIEKSNILIKDGRIELVNSVDPETADINSRDLAVYDAKGRYLAPGFIDIHTHGAVGVDSFCQDFDPWINYNFRNGVTSFLPTIITMPLEDMVRCINNLSGKIEEEASGLLGINLEGPYMSPYFGMQLADFCIRPQKRDYSKILQAANGKVKIMTVAPELDGSYDMIEEFVKNDIIISIGHTDATGKQTEKAISLGANLATHIFNAFGYPGGLFKETRKGKICGVREVKAIDILLENDDIYTEVISDKNGVHVSPVFLKILVKCKPIDKIILITDSMKCKGLPVGDDYLPDGRIYTTSKNEDVCWLKGEKILSGSVLNLRNAVLNLMRHTGINLIDAIKTVTINPARLLGLDKDIGSIEQGKKADIVVFDKDMNVYFTFVNGELVYKA